MTFYVDPELDKKLFAKNDVYFWGILGRLRKVIFAYIRKERCDFGCLLRWLVTRIGLANFVNQSVFRKLAASQSQVEGN